MPGQPVLFATYGFVNCKLETGGPFGVRFAGQIWIHIHEMAATEACPLPWAQPAAARGISATVGEIAAVGLVGRLAADAGPVTRRAERALDAIAEFVRYDGAALATWDPVARVHRHVAARGVPSDVLDYCASA